MDRIQEAKELLKLATNSATKIMVDSDKDEKEKYKSYIKRLNDLGYDVEFEIKNLSE
ncbi:hypothetical protein [Enterococcus sp. DIV1444a]|uniref:hypothetical protein n=1 Tax=Enterococcus sp. DIV1444a TaxID=2774679 RepID=UPI003F27D979